MEPDLLDKATFRELVSYIEGFKKDSDVYSDDGYYSRGHKLRY